MQSHNAYSDRLASSPAAHDNGAANAIVDSAEPYVHPTIPSGCRMSSSSSRLPFTICPCPSDSWATD